MSRTAIFAAIISLLLHAGIAIGGQLLKAKPVAKAGVPETPTIEIELPPPPEPEEPETVDNQAAEAPSEVPDFVPPMQNDVPTASYDAPFQQAPLLPPMPGPPRQSSPELPKFGGPPRASSGAGFGKVFDMGDLDQKLEPRLRPLPIYPFEMRRSGLKGEVVVEFIVDTQGNVREPVIVRSTHPGFEQAALDAVLKWKFKPGKKGGAAVNTRARQIFPFTLQAD